ncbi:hypothetical protein BD626DRAFT_575810 [Schizophyllum amplum]|uniref:RING-type domain-containing protein n=1 Tax=Schizophyllum amplum TaxID=97359 RepID=A0A550BUX6_9AGAR|nr:hypothetical protein BD626DRAFT_575810 [Auriculariopsis ampla]
MLRPTAHSRGPRKPAHSAVKPADRPRRRDEAIELDDESDPTVDIIEQHPARRMPYKTIIEEWTKSKALLGVTKKKLKVMRTSSMSMEQRLAALLSENNNLREQITDSSAQALENTNLRAQLAESAALAQKAAQDADSAQADLAFMEADLAFRKERGDEIERHLACPICLGANTTAYALQPCGHIFCINCIAAVCKRPKGGPRPPRRCPTCRELFKKVALPVGKYHQQLLLDLYTLAGDVQNGPQPRAAAPPVAGPSSPQPFDVESRSDEEEGSEYEDVDEDEIDEEEDEYEMDEDDSDDDAIINEYLTASNN